MSPFHLLCLLLNLMLLNGQLEKPNTLKEFREIMSDPESRNELKNDLLSKGVSPDVLEKEDTFDEMLVFTFLNYACNIETYLPKAVNERVDPKTDCCKRLFVLDCVIDKSEKPMKDSIKVDSVHCNDYLIDPRECDLHVCDLKRMQLKSIACYNDVIQTFGRQLPSCCIQDFHSQCFNHNFMTDCKKVLTKESNGKCDKMAKVEDHCRNFRGCPVYHVKTFNKSFFTSRIFIGSLILIITLFIGFYFICQRCNQPDTSFEIARDKSKAKTKKEKQGNSCGTPSTSVDKEKRRLKIK